MLSVRIWNLQSDSNAEAVKFLKDKFWKYRQLGDIAIRTTGRRALHKCHKKGILLSNNLKKAIQYYLEQDDYIIFVIPDPVTYGLVKDVYAAFGLDARAIPAFDENENFILQ